MSRRRLRRKGSKKKKWKKKKMMTTTTKKKREEKEGLVKASQQQFSWLAGSSFSCCLAPFSPSLSLSPLIIASDRRKGRIHTMYTTHTLRRGGRDWRRRTDEPTGQRTESSLLYVCVCVYIQKRLIITRVMNGFSRPSRLYLFFILFSPLFSLFFSLLLLLLLLLCP